MMNAKKWWNKMRDHGSKCRQVDMHLRIRRKIIIEKKEKNWYKLTNTEKQSDRGWINWEGNGNVAVSEQIRVLTSIYNSLWMTYVVLGNRLHIKSSDSKDSPHKNRNFLTFWLQPIFRYHLIEIRMYFHIWFVL